MRRLLVAVAALSSAAALAQGTEQPPPADLKDKQIEELRRELDEARKEIKEMREEVRAQLATQSVAQGWQEEWVEEKRKLELFVPDGYFRIRPELFHKLDLNRAPDPSGYTLFPRSPTSTDERTHAGVNMRFRFEPTFNVSEEVRVRLQVDALDNLLFGSTPDYAFSRAANTGYAYDRNEFDVFSETQEPARSGINSAFDAIAVKRVYAEVSTPVGILRFGRMGSHWGLGILHNDGNEIDADFGDTVDRLMFVTEPITGWYVTPMLDFNSEGPLSAAEQRGAPFDLSNSDDAHSFIVAAARRDTEQQARAKLENNLSVFNYGVHFTYRVQRNDPVGFYGQSWQNEGGHTDRSALSGAYVSRNATLYMPDVWLKYERRLFRIELELAAVFGGIENRSLLPGGSDRGLRVLQFGGAAQGEYRFMDGALALQLEVGLASGDRAPGLGNYPRRRTALADGSTQPGDIDGPQYDAFNDDDIRNFRFDRAYRIDLILWRELLGSVTDALYVKPTLDYKVAEGFHLLGSAIYSRALYPESTPSWNGATGDPNLGVELNAGAKYETEDGFFATVQWGILFPLGGLADTRPGAAGQLDTANVLRGSLGVKF